ncbi:M56 family metallopeptidase [Poriferisphaera sp. WC338]|uniref:M56 family metallopeptidase n=1 Tax=Poriferisphaera sp. WC338 TaxID=3425129 RepID=UPI003D81C44B
MIVWLMTFLVHSTLWCGLAWIVLRLRPGMHARLREVIWYTAIVASLVTPTARLMTGSESAIWQITMPGSIVSSTEHVDVDGVVGASGSIDVEVTEREAVEASHRDAVVASDTLSWSVNWSRVVPWVWLAGAGILLTLYLIRLAVFRRRLLRRDLVRDHDVDLALNHLSQRACLRRKPRLTRSNDLGSPIAIGFGKGREICMPSRALDELGQEELSAMLGHEIAHHLRYDTFKLGLLNVLKAVFFFQLLFRVAARDLYMAAEEQCDDWAAGQVEDPLVMARCLTEVAGWMVQRDRSIPVPCMAGRRSGLRMRVERLMDRDLTTKALGLRWCLIGSVMMLITAVWFAPAMARTVEVSHDEVSEAKAEWVDTEHIEERVSGDDLIFDEHGESSHRAIIEASEELRDRLFERQLENEREEHS